jgi:hypothetical protein
MEERGGDERSARCRAEGEGKNALQKKNYFKIILGKKAPLWILEG